VARRRFLTFKFRFSTRCQFHQCFMRSFNAHRSRKRIKTVKSSVYLFTLLGSAGAKAVYRILIKLTPGINFINILRPSLHMKFCHQKLQSCALSLNFFLRQNIGTKCTCKMLKLTTAQCFEFEMLACHTR